MFELVYPQFGALNREVKIPEKTPRLFGVFRYKVKYSIDKRFSVLDMSP